MPLSQPELLARLTAERRIPLELLLILQNRVLIDVAVLVAQVADRDRLEALAAVVAHDRVSHLIPASLRGSCDSSGHDGVYLYGPMDLVRPLNGGRAQKQDGIRPFYLRSEDRPQATGHLIADHR